MTEPEAREHAEALARSRPEWSAMRVRTLRRCWVELDEPGPGGEPWMRDALAWKVLLWAEDRGAWLTLSDGAGEVLRTEPV